MTRDQLTAWKQVFTLANQIHAIAHFHNYYDDPVTLFDQGLTLSGNRSIDNLVGALEHALELAKIIRGDT